MYWLCLCQEIEHFAVKFYLISTSFYSPNWMTLSKPNQKQPLFSLDAACSTT
jgi:hypothetical protein